MKKILSVLVAIMAVASLSACGSVSNNEAKKPTEVITNNNAGDETQRTEQPQGTEQPQEIDQQQEIEPPQGKEVTISETVLVDEGGVKITAKSLSFDGIFGPEIKLLIENNSGKDLTVQGRKASVNGYMVETIMSVDVVDGKKANDTLTFLKSDLNACGIETIADMEFSFHIFTTSGWDDYLDTTQIQLKTSAADTYEYTFDDSGDVAYDGNGAKIVVKGLDDSSFLGSGILVYIENNGDKDFTVQVRDVSVNGFMIDPIFSSEVMAGKHAIDTITFMGSSLEENDIAEIETVELSFHIFESSGWETIVDTDTVTINF